MSKQIDLKEYKETPIIKKMKRSNKEEELNKIEKKKGRKPKYNTDEERVQARKEQQKAYRERKKREIEELKEKLKILENLEEE